MKKLSEDQVDFVAFHVIRWAYTLTLLAFALSLLIL